jgi:uncharacterized membrane protein (TIGR01666 family)
LIQKNVKEARYFLYSQAFADGLRASFAILLPSLIGSYFGYFEEGLSISLGAMCVSLTDAPGPIVHKRNGMLFCIAFIFLISIITGFARLYDFTMALEILLVTFFFSMFNVYGNRAAAVGNAAVLIMILTMDKSVSTTENFLHSALVLIGGFFYFFLSMALHTIRPYRHAQRALGDCIRELADYLSLRADFYNTTIDIDENYRKLIAKQITVNEKQDHVREVFFKTRQIVKESTDESRKLVFTFVETVDLFEDITASYYDYVLLRKQFSDTGALDIIHDSLKKIVGELERVGIAIQSGSSFSRSFDYDEEIKSLKAKIDATTQNEPNRLVLKKIVVNIRNMLGDINNILQYFDTSVRLKKSNVDHSHFITHQPLDPKIIWDNLSLESSVFRHAIRVCLACMIGFSISRIIAYGQHSYWILLTIAFILKPAFSLTKQRNIERIIGTFAGGAAGILILYFISDTTVLFVFMVLFMIGTYSFMRINYLAMVVCTTPYVLILFSFFGAMFKDVARERVFDTLIGCAIAFLASYLLFPKWESEQLKTYMKNLLKANAAYLHKILEALTGQKFSMLEYKLARKEVYLSSANLSAAFQRMLSEPKNKQNAVKDIQQFVVMNHILFSNIATVATTLIAKEARIYPEELTHLARKANQRILESTKRLGEDVEETKIPSTPMRIEKGETSDDRLMKEQLQFIVTVSENIDKVARVLAGEPK